MPEAIRSILDQVRLTTLVDIGITAVLIYWLFSLIRGTRAVRLVIGVSVLFAVYAVWIYADVLDFIHWTLLAVSRTSEGYTVVTAAGMIASMLASV